MDVVHGNWRAPKASRPIITVDATEDAMKQLLAALGIPSLDFAIGEPGQEEVMMQVSTTGSFPFPRVVAAGTRVPCVLPILPVMTCRSGSPGAMPYDAQARGRDARLRLVPGRRRPGDWLDLRLLRDPRNDDARGGLDPARTVEPERRSSSSNDSRHRRGGPPSRGHREPLAGHHRRRRRECLGESNPCSALDSYSAPRAAVCSLPSVLLPFCSRDIPKHPVMGLRKIGRAHV